MHKAQHKTKSSHHARHQVKGGIYLVVADNTEEFFIALEYAGKMANANACHVGVLRVLEDQGFQHWGGIEERMRQEQKDEAEAVFAEVSARLKKYKDVSVEFYLEEGGRMETLTRVIEDNPNITMLILAGGTQGASPGPLVSYFTGKGLPKLRVPLMIVPDHVDP